MRTGRTVVPTVLAAVLVLSTSGLTRAASPSPVPDQSAPGSATVQPSTEGFPTPEDAIREYLAGVAQSDASRILGASAIDEVSTGFDFAASADRLRAFIPADSLAPAEYPLYAEMNRTLVSQRILRKVLMLAYNLLATEPLDGGVVAPVDAAWAEAFATTVDPSRPAGLAVEDIRFSDATFSDDPRYLANVEKQARVVGADELTERLVLFSFEGRLYDLGFTLVRYGGGWKVLDQVASLAGTPTLGMARPTTAADYERTTSGD